MIIKQPVCFRRINRFLDFGISPTIIFTALLERCFIRVDKAGSMGNLRGTRVGFRLVTIST